MGHFGNKGVIFVAAWKRVWVTAAEDDDSVNGALRLARSLRRTITRKKLVVVPGKNVSEPAR